MSTNGPARKAPSLPQHLAAYVVDRTESGAVSGQWVEIPLDRLPAGDTLIRVEWSSLNYKDALAAQGHPGVVRQFPHVPGIDAAGTVIASAAGPPPGTPVLVTGYEMGSGAWGGWSEYIRVPTPWVIPLPDRLTTRQAMALGTAGLTAAQCVQELIRAEIAPQDGPIVVTGATGGVGNLALQILSQLGYHVVAVTGKASAHEWLKQLGAAEVVGRETLHAPADRPLLSGRWAGAVDTVGGATLSTLVRSLQPHGCVAACGLVGGTELALTVHPFLLRGVKLAGVTSALCKPAVRATLWQTLAGPWRPAHLDQVTEVLEREDLTAAVGEILAGRIQGRRIVRVTR
ncbi:MAG: acryloyl-CoA reductase [Pirellulales bacterium]